MSAPISREASVKIVNLSFFLAVFVVIAHVRWVADGAFGRAMITLFAGSMARVPIPFYFMVSGFFLAAHFQDVDWWRTAVRRRIDTLLIPYLFWQTVFALIMLLLTRRWVVGICGYGLNPCRLPMVAPFWYLRTLMAFVVVSPIIRRFIERWGVKAIVMEYAACMLLSILTSYGLLEYYSGLGGFLCFGFSLEGLIYFSAGIYLQSHRITVHSWRWPTFCLMAGIALSFVRFFMDEWHIALPFHPSMLTSPLLLMGFWYFTPSVPWPKGIVSCSFPIYLIHIIVLEGLWAVGVPHDAVWQWVVFALGVSVPMIVSHVMHRWIPRVAALAFGGR